jgi:hypothetical protein
MTLLVSSSYSSKLSAPLNDVETFEKVLSPSISFSSDSSLDSIGVSIITYSSQPSGAITNSSVLGLQMNAYQKNGLSSRRLSTFTADIVVTLINPKPIVYRENKPELIFIECHRQILGKYIIKGSCGNGFNYEVKCPGTIKGTHSITCPGFTEKPVCNTWDSALNAFNPDPSCSPLLWTPYNTTCKCSNSRNTNSRLLGISTNNIIQFATTSIVEFYSYDVSWSQSLPKEVRKPNNVIFGSYFNDKSVSYLF